MWAVELLDNLHALCTWCWAIQPRELVLLLFTHAC